MSTHVKTQMKRATLTAAAVLMSMSAVSAWADKPQAPAQTPALIGHIEVTAHALRVANASTTNSAVALLGQMTVTARRVSTALADGMKAVESAVESAGESPTPPSRRSPRAVLVQ